MYVDVSFRFDLHCRPCRLRPIGNLGDISFRAVQVLKEAGSRIIHGMHCQRMVFQRKMGESRRVSDFLVEDLAVLL